MFGNEYNLYNTVLPIRDEIWLHIPIRDKFNLITPYFIGWNLDAIKSYINMLSGVNDKEVTVKINNLYCEFEETIEFLKGIFNISGIVKDQKVRTYTRSLAIPFNFLNIQMKIITYGGKMSPKHCWNNFTLTQAINIWEQNDDRMPRNAEIWLGNKKLLITDFPIANLEWEARINLIIKGDGGSPLEETYKIGRRKFFEAI
jgi:hypothetical protein